MFARRPLQFPPRYPRSCAKTRTHCRHTFRASLFTKRSIRGKSNYGSILRQPCRYYLKGTCTRTPREYWHPPECQFYKKKKGCESGDTCLFPQYKVDEQPNIRPKKGYFPKGRESEDKGAVAIVKSVSQLGCVLQDSNALDSQGTKGFRGNPMQKVLNAIQRVRFTKSTIRHASIRDKKGPSLGRIQVKPRHQQSPYATRFEDRPHEETERQERCAQSKAWDLVKKRYKLKAKDKATLFWLAKWVLPAASTKEPEEREFVVYSGASMHVVSKKDLNSAELESMRTSRSRTTVLTANGEVRTNKGPTVYVKQLDLFVTALLLQETPAVLSLGETLRITWVHVSLDKRSEPTSHQRRRKN